MFTQLLKELLNELELTKGKNCLIFIILNGSSSWIEDRIEEDGFEIYRVNLSREDMLFKLVDILLKWRETEENIVYFVQGIMNQAPEILSYLNLHRDFLYDIKRPIIVLGSKYDMNGVFTLAPDLWRFRSRTYDFSGREKEILPEYVPSLPAVSFGVREAPSLLSWDGEELKKRIDLDEHLLETITDDYRRSELYENLVIYYFTLDDLEKSDENLCRFRELRRDDLKELSVIYNRLGEACFSKKKLENALEYFSKAIGLDPEYEKAYHNRGIVYYELERFEEAIADYNRVIELDPGYVLAYKNRGLVYLRLNQFEKAIADFDKAIEVDPGIAQAYNNRGWVYYRLNQFEKAIAEFDKAIELDPGLALAYDSRGDLYFRLKEFDRAIEDYSKAIKLDPEDAEPYYKRGLVYSELERSSEAVRDYTKAIEINSEYPEAYESRGITHSLMENYKKAAKDLKRAGILYFKSKRIEDSIEAFSICFDLRQKIKNDDVIYSGLLLYLLTSHKDIPIELNKLDISNELLKGLFELIREEIHDKDVSRDIVEFKGKEDINAVLKALKNFKG
ncbi:MAG: hypothetical protein AYK19_11950 [Theionarchaea archaeon DG-70-1]|nr:MAG: hypothetical protein AYK19_11950 [Theionarchaea archaeon DG-70-1]